VDGIFSMLFRNTRDLGLKIVDIHAGGGTPSLLSKEWAEIIQTIREYFDVQKGCRFGMEANPDDLAEDKAFLFRESGVDEISIGVQSFLGTILRCLEGDIALRDLWKP
jgi:oxygen-independent coproporphyrinogen-3 oxidase